VHYPSDTRAGQLIAEECLKLILPGSRIRGLIDTARAEYLKAAEPTPAGAP
jgi:hypothetical protein